MIQCIATSNWLTLTVGHDVLNKKVTSGCGKLTSTAN